MPAEELRILRTWHPNLLIGGSPQATDAAIEALRDVFRPRIERWAGESVLPAPPDGGVGTLILDGVERLTRTDQERLLAWLQEDFGRVQVVATTARPLLEMVEAGEFNAALYYALNVVHVRLSS